LTAYICGNRFGRSVLIPNGMLFDFPSLRINDFEKKLDAAFIDAKGACELLWDNSGILSRFENTGVVSNKAARELGLVGIAAKASGLGRDWRSQSWPYEIYQGFKIAVETSGDIYARARVRWREMESSYELLKRWIKIWQKEQLTIPTVTTTENLQDFSLAVSFCEGWRGEVCHVAMTDNRGRFLFYKIVDPSFHNWTALSLAMRNEEIYDFPLCNKSFNLSYCGQDL